VAGARSTQHDGARRRRLCVELVHEGSAAAQNHSLVQRSLDGDLERRERRRFFEQQRARHERRAAGAVARQLLERASNRVSDPRMRDIRHDERGRVRTIVSGNHDILRGARGGGENPRSKRADAHPCAG